MKLKLLLTILFLKYSLSFAQPPETPKGAIQIDQSTIIKDTSGNVITFDQFIGMINSGEWAAEPKLNDHGELDFLQIRKATEEEKNFMSAMRSGPNESNRIGETLPTFELTDIKGKKFNSEDLIGKIIVINLWFTACKPCIMEMPELNKVYDKYKNNSNVVFVSITYNGAKEVKKFLKKHKFNYPVITDAMEACNSFKVQGYPTNIIVDQSGKYSFFATGSFQGIEQVLEIEIDKLLVR